MLFDLLFDGLVDGVLSPVFDRITGAVAGFILMIGCVLCFALWWVSGAVAVLVLSGLFGAAAAVSLVESRRS